MTVAITRMEHTAAELRRYAACSVDTSVARRLLALALVLDGHKREDAARAAGSPKREAFAAGTGKPCAIGRTATTRTALQAWAAGMAAASSPGFRPSRRRRLPIGYALDPMSRRTASCAGAAWRSKRGLRAGSASPCTSAAWASRAKPLLCPGCIGSALPGCPRARATPRQIRRRKRLSGRVRRPAQIASGRFRCDRSTARRRAGGQDAHRGLAPGRGPRRPARRNGAAVCGWAR